MNIRKLLSALPVLFLLGAQLTAQDIHFSQFNMSPMTLNPANIGAFEGTARIGGIYRSQWTSVLGSNQFETPSVYADAPIIRGFRKKDWVGVGLVFFTDKAGILGLTHTAAKLGASYHLALNKKGTTYITLGAQYGQASRRLNPEGARFYEGYKNKGSQDYNQNLDVDFANLSRDKVNWTDIDGGIVLKSKLNERMDFSIGYAMYHIAEGRYGLVTGGSSTPGGPVQTSGDEIPRRSVATGQFNIKMNDKFTVSPTFIYQTMSGADEIIVQALGGYLFNAEKEITLLFGLGYRFRDAFHPMIGAQYKALRVGLAYDVNISGLNPQTNYRGGFELAANYIIRIYKPAVIKTKVLCPRF
ncbi:MAG: PorP/SprF family type IX secretion system membrane protein [Saprospiraceae bacterium]|nr:PorP/SprF family type IX secretion system membrane protein [Saprospiraceae bacterium]